MLAQLGKFFPSLRDILKNLFVFRVGCLIRQLSAFLSVFAVLRHGVHSVLRDTVRLRLGIRSLESQWSKWCSPLRQNLDVRQAICPRASETFATGPRRIEKLNCGRAVVFRVTDRMGGDDDVVDNVNDQESGRSIAMLHFCYAQIKHRVESLILPETPLSPSFGQIAIFVLSNRHGLLQ
jgi:hypothetical protein